MKDLPDEYFYNLILTIDLIPYNCCYVCTKLVSILQFIG